MLTHLSMKKLDDLLDEVYEALCNLEFFPSTTDDFANFFIFLDEIQQKVHMYFSLQERWLQYIS